MEKEQSKVLRDSVRGKDKYVRIPIARKILGTGQKDSRILIDSGVPEELADLAYCIKTGMYLLDPSLKNKDKDNYCASFSTTKLLSILPDFFLEGGNKFGIMLYPGPITEFGRRYLKGLIVDTENEQIITEFSGHPVTVLVKLIEYANNHEDKI